MRHPKAHKRGTIDILLPGADYGLRQRHAVPVYKKNSDKASLSVDVTDNALESSIQPNLPRILATRFFTLAQNQAEQSTQYFWPATLLDILVGPANPQK